MKNIKLRNILIPFALYSIATVAQANESDSAESYIGVSTGVSELVNDKTENQQANKANALKLNKRVNNISVFLGTKEFIQNDFFIGAEVQGTLYREKNPLLNDEKFNSKRKYALNGDLSIGQRFNISEKISFDLFGLAGYGITKFNKKLAEANQPSQNSKNKNAHSVRYGIGATVVLDRQFGITGKFVRSNLRNVVSSNNKLKLNDFSLSIQYSF